MQITIESEDQMLQLGALLAQQLPTAAVVYLEGDLGAGKTTLTRGIIHGLGYSGRVKSPTYTLIEPYQVGELTVYHLDLYRLTDPEELEYLGVRDLFDGQILVIVEWPDKGGQALPEPDLLVQIQHAGDSRNIEFGVEGVSHSWLESFQAQAAVAFGGTEQD